MLRLADTGSGRGCRRAGDGPGAAGRVRVGDNDAAAEFGEAVIYTARGVDPAEVLTSASLLDGKIVMDINNQDIPEDFVYPPVAKSLAELLADQAPRARVVKAFNTMGQRFSNYAPTRSGPIGCRCSWPVTTNPLAARC